MSTTATTRQQFLDEVVEGLSAAQKTLPCKYLYDEKGSKLFDQICELEDYYPTRADLEATRINLDEIAKRVGPKARLVELGSGSSMKTELLLKRLDLAEYVPLDISTDHLEATAEDIRKRYPDLVVQPAAADYTQPVNLPEPQVPFNRTVVYFPGSTIGNFHPDEAAQFLSRIGSLVSGDSEAGTKSGGILIGVDLRKERARLERAYDDSEGVTAKFNLNLLRHINRELGAEFPLERFEHRAVWDSEAGRIEMHLVSLVDQEVEVGDESFSFKKGEYIRSEVSYKYSREGFAELAAKAGLKVDAFWTDSQGLFSLQYLVPAG